MPYMLVLRIRVLVEWFRSPWNVNKRWTRAYLLGNLAGRVSDFAEGLDSDIMCDISPT